eukprot:1192903-Rhodomonas_salina.1
MVRLLLLSCTSLLYDWYDCYYCRVPACYTMSGSDVACGGMRRLVVYGDVRCSVLTLRVVLGAVRYRHRSSVLVVTH